jgi:hypothetical protein
MTLVLNKATSFAIRGFIVIGLAILVIGLAAGSDMLMKVGLGFMIASPLAGLFASLGALLYERDMKWAIVALVLIVIVIARVVVSVFF